MNEGAERRELKEEQKEGIGLSMWVKRRSKSPTIERNPGGRRKEGKKGEMRSTI